MSSNVYRNLGRGGAGNYYSKTDLEDVAKRIPEVIYTMPRLDNEGCPDLTSPMKDIEAQNPPTEAATDATTSNTQEYSHLGRGGAGNVALSALMEGGATSDPQPSGQPNQMSGRGGAGNYYGAEQRMLEVERAAKEAEETEETLRRIQQDAKVDVEKGLVPPQKAYMGL